MLPDSNGPGVGGGTRGTNTERVTLRCDHT
jgi:hypothetical protein